MVFKHGVTVNERQTQISSQGDMASAIPVCFGTAPKGRIHTPVVVRSYAEAVAEFGFSEDFERFTLHEFIHSHFVLYKQSYAILVNVADPAIAKNAVTATIDMNQSTVTVQDCTYPVLDSVKVEQGGTVFVKDKDYALAVNEAGLLVIKLLLTTNITLPATALKITCDTIDMTKVTYTDFIGTTDTVTGKRTGFEVLDEIIPTLRIVPGLVIAPKYSVEPVVSAALVAKSQSINGMFKAFVLTDMDPATVRTAEQAVQAKKTGDAGQLICWPKVARNNRVYHMSTHLAGIMGQVDASSNGVPSSSPSNHQAQVDSLVLSDGTPVRLGVDQANNLNGAGITTVLFFVGGPRAWGNRTAAYPETADMKDALIHAKRMLFWINNWLITDTWANVDSKITKRFLEAVTTKHNMRLNGLTSAGDILGGACKFDPLNNPASQLLDGNVKFLLSVGIPGVAEHIEFDLEIDPSFLEGLTL